MLMVFPALALVGAAVPPAPSGRVLAPGEVEVVDPIAGAVARYDGCLTGEFDKKHPLGLKDAAKHRREMVKAIASCRKVRREAVGEAERELAKAPDYQDKARRDLAIRHAFEGTEEMRRTFGALQLNRDIPLPNPRPAPTATVSPRSMPAISSYVNCVSDGINLAAREKVADQNARRARAASIDTQCRAVGIAAAPKVKKGRIEYVDEAQVELLKQAMSKLSPGLFQSYVDPEAMRARLPAAPQ